MRFLPLTADQIDVRVSQKGLLILKSLKHDVAEISEECAGAADLQLCEEMRRCRPVRRARLRIDCWYLRLRFNRLGSRDGL